MIGIQILQPSDTSAFRALRLIGLEESPAAFAQTKEQFSAISIADLRKWIGPGERRCVVGAFSGDQLVGLAGLHPESHPDRSYVATVWGLYVLPEYRGRGISRSLMQTLITEAKRMPEVRMLTLRVSPTQSIARQLYSSLGFSFSEEMQKELRVGEEEIDKTQMYMEI